MEVLLYDGSRNYEPVDRIQSQMNYIHNGGHSHGHIRPGGYSRSKEEFYQSVKGDVTVSVIANCQ